ncbi:MAG: hypothetical protein RIQ81_1060 [Pseudomonadota bacterium]|jgi:hypothetical protein
MNRIVGLRAGFIALGLLLGATPGCRNRSQGGAGVKAYEENGVVWGYGDFRLSSPPAAAGIFLDRLPQRGPNGQMFKLVGADTGTGAIQDLFYVDWHPSSEAAFTNTPVVFVSQFFLQERAGNRGLMDVYVKLKKTGRSWPGSFTLSVGTADIRDPNSARYPVSLAQGAKLATIDGCAQCNGLAFMYAEIPYSAPIEIPTERLTSEGFGTARQGSDQVLTLAGEAQGKLVFIARTMQAQPADHARLCHESFTAVARTAANRVNPACKLTLAPANGVLGLLTCAVLVKFESPASAAEKTCRVIGAFSGTGDSSDQLSAVIVNTPAASPGADLGVGRRD